MSIVGDLISNVLLSTVNVMHIKKYIKNLFPIYVVTGGVFEPDSASIMDTWKFLGHERLEGGQILAAIDFVEENN